MPLNHLTPKQAKSLSTKLYAPNNVGFTHTLSSQFSYFEGSKVGNQTTFGMPAKQLVDKFKGFLIAMQKKYAGHSVGIIRNQIIDLEVLYGKLKSMLTELDAKLERGYQPYYDSRDFVSKSKEFGHIPLTMSKLTGAAQYNKAARNLDENEVNWYIENVSGSFEQLQEYIYKQQLMKAIAERRESIVKARFLHPDQSSDDFFFFNDFILQLDDMVIKENQKTMPKSAQFDLLPIFIKTLMKIISHQIPDQPRDLGELRDTLALEIQLSNKNNEFEKTYVLQEAVSNKVYDILKAYLHGLGMDAEDVELTEDMDDKLQSILPLIAYLNSSKNPFARDGVYGEVVSSPFHREALEAYIDSELEQEIPHMLRMALVSGSPDEKGASPEFTAEQMEQLIYGSGNAETVQAQAPLTVSEQIGGFFASFGRAIMGAVTDGNEDAHEDTRVDRDEVLALPTPEVYLAITAGADFVLQADEEPENHSSSSAAASSSSSATSSIQPR